MLRKQDADGGWADVPARQFGEEVTALAKGLIASGIGAGDRVGVMSRTSYAWTLIDYAIWSVRAVTVPVYETSCAEHVQWILSDSGAVAVFAETPPRAATIDGAKSAMPDIASVWQLEAGAGLAGVTTA